MIYTETSLKCEHCSDQILGEPIVYEEKNFCCNGCKTVYEILSEKGLCQYYSIDEKSAFTLKARKDEKFDYLDQEEIENKILSFKSKNLNKVTFNLPQIHCSSLHLATR